MQEVALDLDPAMIDNMRRESETHGFDDLDGYVQWLLQHRDTVLNEHDAWNNPPGKVQDFDADLAQSSGGTLSVDAPSEDADQTATSGSDTGGFESLEPESQEEDPEEEDVELPEEEDGADDDDVAAALEEIDLDDEDE